jgi:hypothetical protein
MSEERAYWVRWIANLDQQISTVEDMLSGRLPLDTLVPEAPLPPDES